MLREHPPVGLDLAQRFVEKLWFHLAGALRQCGGAEIFEDQFMGRAVIERDVEFLDDEAGAVFGNTAVEPLDAHFAGEVAAEQFFERAVQFRTVDDRLDVVRLASHGAASTSSSNRVSTFWESKNSSATRRAARACRA